MSKSTKSVCVWVCVHICVCEQTLLSAVGGWRWNEWEGQRRPVRLGEVCGWMEVNHSGLRLGLTCCLPGWLYPPVRIHPWTEGGRRRRRSGQKEKMSASLKCFCVDQAGSFSQVSFHGWFQVIYQLTPGRSVSQSMFWLLAQTIGIGISSSSRLQTRDKEFWPGLRSDLNWWRAGLTDEGRDDSLRNADIANRTLIKNWLDSSWFFQLPAGGFNKRWCQVLKSRNSDGAEQTIVLYRLN